MSKLTRTIQLAYTGVNGLPGQLLHALDARGLLDTRDPVVSVQGARGTAAYPVGWLLVFDNAADWA